jgi:hypothetical protein
MDLSGREVGEILGLGRSQTTRLLASGLAGPGHRRGRATLYDAAAVAALRDRRVIGETTPLPAPCTHGVLVARVGPWREVSADVPTMARGPWSLTLSRKGVLNLMREHGPVPLVVTVAGFVLGGGEVTGYAYDRPTTLLQTCEPGAWFETFREARVPLGPGEPLRFWRCAWDEPMSHRRTAGMTTLEVRPARPRATAG